MEINTNIAKGSFLPLTETAVKCQALPLQCNAGCHDNNYCTFATSASMYIDWFA